MRALFTIIVIFTFQVGFTQTINLEIADSHPELQDADVGDMEFADIDNDGDQDLIIIGKGGPILTTIYVNDGDGNFIESNNTELVNVFNGTIGVADIDTDGDLDLLISGTTSSLPSTNLYLNDGSGIFSPSNTTLSPSSSGDFAFGDVDNDDDLDLFLTGQLNFSGDLFSILYLNDGNGNFTASPTSSFEAFASRVEFFDCDGDNDLDLIISGANFDTNAKATILYVNDGSGNFSIDATAAFNNISGGDLTTGDIDNDGDLDVLICGNDANGTVTELYLNNGTGEFTLLPNTELPNISTGEISLNDFDNDDDLDIFLLGTGPGGLANDAIIGNIYENIGDNNFIIADSLIGGYLSSHAVADIDGDNDLDLVLGGTTIGTPTRATWLYTNETPIVSNDKDFSLVAIDRPEVFPNPFQGSLTVQLESELIAVIEIYSKIGSLVYSNTINAKKAQINLDLPLGTYTMKVVTSANNYIQKVISIR